MQMKYLYFNLFLLLLFSCSATSVERFTLKGNNFEMGEQWGAKQKNLINGLKIQFNGMLSLYLKKSKEEIDAQSKKIAPFLAPEEIDELKGIAKATDSTFEEILNFNLFYTLAVTNLGCRQFVTWGDKTEDGELIHSRNLDWNDYPGSPMKKFITIINYQEKN